MIFRRIVAACSRALASPWAMDGVLLYAVGSTAWLIYTGGKETDQLWLNHFRNIVTLWALIALHARDEQKPAVPKELDRRLSDHDARLERIEVALAILLDRGKAPCEQT